MAMMMTGRVLLVCALCVLWCGSGGGFAEDESPAVGASADVGGRQPKPPQLETTPSNVQGPKRPSADVGVPMLEVADTSLEGTDGDDVEDEEEEQSARKGNEGIRAQGQHGEHDRQNDQHDEERNEMPMIQNQEKEEKRLEKTQRQREACSQLPR
ncbi:mucin-associated surface protein (MASP), putative, partial [Trypanosoma cruzi]